jgi:cyanate lyase
VFWRVDWIDGKCFQASVESMDSDERTTIPLRIAAGILGEASLRRVSLGDVARKLGSSPAYMSRVLRGHRRLSREDRAALRAALLMVGIESAEAL